MALALITGYICSLFFHIGHSYWILLTIVVILKPAYSLTKKRNADRLLGTFLGVLAGIFILLVIKNNTALLIIMIFLMAGSYIFLRTSYFTSVLFMTPYLVIFFHLLNPANLKMVLSDRIIDTAIGSGIAFLANIFLIPQWGYVTIRKFMMEALESNMKYYMVLANAYSTHTILENQLQKQTRKEALVAHANLSDAFNQILSEPKRFQKNTETIHQFVVLNHLLAPHLATLSYYLKFKKTYFRSHLLLPVIENNKVYFNAAKNCILGKEDLAVNVQKNPFGTINKYVEDLLSKRKEEISAGEYETGTKEELVKVKSVVDQFNYIFTVSGDIYKCAKSL